jgi:hypothetical protein
MHNFLLLYLKDNLEIFIQTLYLNADVLLGFSVRSFYYSHTILPKEMACST